MQSINRRVTLAMMAAATLGLTTSMVFAQDQDTNPPVDPVVFATGDRVLGDPDAPVTLIEYASFTCPHCRDFHTNVFPKIEEQYIDTGKAKLIYREVYFDGPGLLAGSLARCVGEDKYFPMIKALYTDADAWLLSSKSLEDITLGLSKLGLVAGLDKDEIAACLDNRELQNTMIEVSTKNLDEFGVTGTPTIIVDGKKIDNWALENLSKEIDAQIPNDFVAKAMGDPTDAKTQAPASN